MAAIVKPNLLGWLPNDLVPTFLSYLMDYNLFIDRKVKQEELELTREAVRSIVMFRELCKTLRDFIDKSPMFWTFWRTMMRREGHRTRFSQISCFHGHQDFFHQGGMSEAEYVERLRRHPEFRVCTKERHMDDAILEILQKPNARTREFSKAFFGHCHKSPKHKWNLTKANKLRQLEERNRRDQEAIARLRLKEAAHLPLKKYYDPIEKEDRTKRSRELAQARKEEKAEEKKRKIEHQQMLQQKRLQEIFQAEDSARGL